jgi:nitrate reductase gamma subunit
MFQKVDQIDHRIIPYIIEQILVPGSELDNQEI